MFKTFRKLDQSNKTKKSRSLLIGSIVAVIIALTPLIFYSYKFFPSGSTLDLYFYTYESKYQLSIIVYFIRLKLFDKHVLGIDLEAMDRELKAYKEKELKEKERLQKDEMAKEKLS